MPQKISCPKWPVRAAFLSFLVLSAFVGAILPFNELLRRAWPFAFGYCALLSVVAVGLTRLGRRVLVMFAAVAAVALLPGSIGLMLIYRSGTVSSGGDWLRMSLYMLCVPGAGGVGLAARGWWLYFKEPGGPNRSA